MENTGKVLFEKDSAQWYLARGDHWVGPLTAADVYQRVLNQQISWADFVWKPGQAGWERICDIKTFQAAVPQLPGKDLQKEVKEAAQPTSQKGAKAAAPGPLKDHGASLEEEKTWFLYFNESQFGPFSKSEVNRFLATGKITGRVHAWRDGMADWERIERLEEFEVPKEPKAKTAPPAPPKKKTGKTREIETEHRQVSRLDNRGAPRRPLVARIMMAHDEGLAVAMCRDISVGGMQALTDKIPGEVGTHIKMNVSATGDEKLEPFTAQGVIVRILEDGRGFSFRFEKLSDHAKRAIEKYIAATN